MLWPVMSIAQRVHRRLCSRMFRQTRLPRMSLEPNQLGNRIVLQWNHKHHSQRTRLFPNPDPAHGLGFGEPWTRIAISKPWDDCNGKNSPPPMHGAYCSTLHHLTFLPNLLTKLLCPAPSVPTSGSRACWGDGWLPSMTL